MAELGTKVLGITGGIASGKSAVATCFVNWGAYLVDADQIAHEILAPDSPGLAAVQAQFGPAYLRADGSLDRAKLGQLVFSDPQALAQLNQLTQPLIRTAIMAAIARGRDSSAPLVVAEIPLLIEENYQTLCDGILVADLPEALQLARVQKRDGLTKAAAQARLAAQIGRTQRLAAADFILDTSHDLATLTANFQRFIRSAAFQSWLRS
ncbi:dephospho-CoA kinase [Lapidilactobacillus salsurivasis]